MEYIQRNRIRKLMYFLSVLSMFTAASMIVGIAEFIHSTILILWHSEKKKSDIFSSSTLLDISYFQHFALKGRDV